MKWFAFLIDTPVIALATTAGLAAASFSIESIPARARLMAVITEGTVTIIVKHPIGLATQKG